MGKAMKLIKLVLLFWLLVSAVFVAFGQSVSAEDRFVAKKGEMDLQYWNPFESEDVLHLNGDWEFYWQQLLSPVQLRQKNFERRYAYAPSEWSRMRVDGENLLHNGFATYRLVVRLPKEVVRKQLALYVPASGSAYKVWIDGAEVASAGGVGTDFLSENPWTVSKIVYFMPTSEKMELVVQISNFHQRRNGMWDPFLLGNSDTMLKKNSLDTSLQLMMTGSFIVMSIFYFFMYFFRRSNVTALLFSGICLLFSIRLSVVDGALLRYFIPESSFNIVNKLEYLTVTVGTLLLIQYVAKLFPNEDHPLTLKVLTSMSLMYSLFILVTPVHVFTYSLAVMLMIILFVFIYHVFYVYRLAVIRKRDWAWSNLIASLIMIFAVINDGFYYVGNISPATISYSGFIIYYLVQIITIANQSADAYKQLEVVSSELTDLNTNLESMVQERTSQLEELNKQLIVSNEKLQGIEQSRRKLLSNISHDLGTPMQSAMGYVEMMMKGLIKDNQQKYLQIVFEKLKFIKRLSSDLFELTKFEENQIVYQFVDKELGDFLSGIEKHFALDFQRNKIIFEVEPIQGLLEGEKAYIWIDVFRMERVLQNLLQNAMKHSEEGGTVRIQAEVVRSLGKVMIHVIDTGVGIDAELLPEIFNRFVKGDTARTLNVDGGLGLGLSIVREIVQAHNGDIVANSEKGVGSTFSIILPVSVREGVDGGSHIST